MLYFIQSGSRIKIGHGNPLVRYRTINTASPDPCRLLLAIHIENEHAAEQTLHRHFKAHRRNGEWFEINFVTAFRALLDLRLMPEHDCPTLELPNPPPPPIHPRFVDWLLATRAQHWSAEAIEDARVHAQRHWERDHEGFAARLKSHGGDIDRMIRMARPERREDPVAFLATMRRQMLQRES
jgi:hypothetical protein